MSTTENETTPALCPQVLRGYRPFDADRGIEHEPRDVRCISALGHGGYHRGDDGLPFGPFEVNEATR